MFTDEIVISNTPLPVDGSGVTQPVSGTVNVGNFPATQPVSGTVTAITGGLTDTQLRASPVPTTSTPLKSSSATVSQVALTANTSITLLAANANRIGVTLFVPSSPAYIKFGNAASTTSFSIKVTANNTQLNADDFKDWVGIITILSQTSQTVTVTEY